MGQIAWVIILTCLVTNYVVMDKLLSFSFLNPLSTKVREDSNIGHTYADGIKGVIAHKVTDRKLPSSLSPGKGDEAKPQSHL